MKLRLSAAAEADLIDIYVIGVRDFGVAQAEAYQDRLEHAIELIADTPLIARLRKEIAPPVRVHPVGSHIVIYHVEENGPVRILRVRHQREDWIANPVGGEDRITNG